MVDSSKMVYGDQFQIRLDPSKLIAKRRDAWGRIYVAHQAERVRMFMSSAALATATGLSFIAGIEYEGSFLIIAFVLGFFTLRAFFNFGYQKGLLDDWDTKIMVRVDK